MQGRRNPQHSLWEAQAWPHAVPRDSFFGRMSAICDQLFRDDDLADMYCPDNGRPSWPPSLMSGITLLQFFTDVSDEEAIDRLRFDLRWKVALNLPLDFEPPDSSTLCVFRRRLLEHGRERYAFDRLVQVGRAAGFIPDKVTLLMDTTPQRGAGAVQDTYTLIRKGIRKVLKAAGYTAGQKRRQLASNLAAYLESDRKAAIDWADPQARAAHLKVLVQDAEAVLALVQETSDPEVRTAAWLLTKVLGDDVESDEGGDPRIAHGVAPDRMVSMTDPEMRHGRKSAAQRFDGRKVGVAADQASELLLAAEPMPANVGDGQRLEEIVASVREQQGVQVERVIADGAFGSGDNRAACAQQGIDLVAPVAEASDAEVAKSAFNIDVETQSATCPQGQKATRCQRVKDAQGRPVLLFSFERRVCEACPLFARCVRSKTEGRSVRTHYHEALLQAARERQRSEEFKALYRLRAAIERVIACLVQHGLRRARYIGEAKVRLQAQWTGAAVNLLRLFTLFEGDIGRMGEALSLAG